MFGVERIVCELATGNLHARLEHGVARIGHEHRIALVKHGKAKYAHPLLRSVNGADHIGRNALHTKTPNVIVAHSLLELGQIAQGVLPHLRVLNSLCDSIDHMRVRLEIRCSHREIVDSSTLGLQSDTAVIEGGENLVTKAIESAGKLHRTNLSIMRNKNNVL